MKSTFKKGIFDGVPICLGYLSVSFAFGIFAVNSGLRFYEALLISMTNLTSAGQLAAVPIITAGGTLLELAASQLVINLRYALMSVSLSQKFDRTVKTPNKLLIGFGVTDEVFAVAAAQRGMVSKQYMFGLILMPYLGWSAGTLLGAIAGDILPLSLTAALGIAIYGMFIAIVVPQAKAERPVLLCVLIAVVLSCIFRYVPFLSCVPAGFVIIICAVLASLAMAIAAPVREEDNSD